MSIKTKYYGLTSFQRGDAYSSALDKSRFTILDNQIYSISDVVGDGVINGLIVSQSGELSLNISVGFAMINGVVTRMFGDKEIPLQDNSVTSIYFQNQVADKPGNKLIGGFGPFSSMVSANWENTNLPSAPNNVLIDDVFYNSVVLGWDFNSELDIDYYKIQRSIDNSTYIDLGTTSSNSYTDNNVSENTMYYYRVFAVNTSNKVSSGSDVIHTTTLVDLSVPPNPIYVLVFPRNEKLQVVWEKPNNNKIDSYRIDIQAVSSEYVATGQIVTFDVSSYSNSYIIDNLSNNQLYIVTVYSVSNNNVFSSGLSVYKSPLFDNGPSELQSLSVIGVLSKSDSKSIQLKISGLPGYDPYKPYSVKYLVTIIENGTIFSATIPVVFNTDIYVQTFYDSSTGNCRKIKTNTDYIVLVQGVDANGNINNGIICKTNTGTLVSPAAPSNLIANLNNPTFGSISFFWQNSKDDFVYNLLTIKAYPMDGSPSIIVVDNLNCQKSTAYILTNVSSGNEYTIEITAIDSNGLRSSTSNLVVSYLFSTGFRPPAATNFGAMGGDGQVLVTWSPPTNFTDIVNYKIWRSIYRDNEYIPVGIVGPDRYYFLDFTVSNNTEYAYFVTIVDSNGLESLNPIDDNYYSYVLASAFPISHIDFSTIVGVQTSVTGSGVNLTWELDNTNYDGYEIYRSKGDSSSWSKIGSSVPQSISFIDKAVLEDGQDTYYYMLRKFINEGKIVTSILSQPDNSIILASVVTENGVINEITDLACDLSSLSCVLDSFFAKKINSHIHSLTSSSDKRIDLSENLIISRWVSNETKTVFTTQERFDGATSYSLYIDDLLVSGNYILDTINRRITFDSSVTSNNIKLLCGGLNETSNELLSEQVGTLSASQPDRGEIANWQIPMINHAGRQHEQLFPLRRPMVTADGYSYHINENDFYTSAQSLGGCVSFFDVCGFSGGLVAATSKGFMVSVDGGQTWTVSLATDYVVYKIKYVSEINRYFGLANGYVYVSDNGMNWARTNRLGNSSIVRDLVYFSDSVYASTDTGMFYINTQTWDNWTQTLLFNGMSSDCYALYNDRVLECLYVGTENGLYCSSDGYSWYKSGMVYETTIYDFAEDNGFVFALSNIGVYRKAIGDELFTKIINLSEHKSRKIVVFNGQVVMLSDNGILVSQYGNNIYSDLSVKVDYYNKQRDFSSRRLPIFSINVLEDSIYLGSEHNLFSGTTLDSVVTIYNDPVDIIPTFYLNGNEQFIGFYYNVENGILIFDEKTKYNDNVSVANQYSIFRAENYGWVDQRFDSVISIYNNDSLLLTANRQVVPVRELSSVSFDDFTEDNSNSVTAKYFESLYSSELTGFTNAVSMTHGVIYNYSLISGNKTVQDYISNLSRFYEQAYSQFLGNIKYVSTLQVETLSYTLVDYDLICYNMLTGVSREYKLIENIPQIYTDVSTDSTVSINISDGIIDFANSYNKTDNLHIDLVNSSISNAGNYTHKEIEDAFAMQTENLSSSLAEILHFNILNKSIFLKNNYGLNAQDLKNTNIIIPETFSSSWYDYENSTVNFYPQNSFTGNSIDIRYPSCVVYSDIQNVVFIGAYNGLAVIDTETLDIVPVVFCNNYTVAIKDLKIHNNTVYVLTDKDVYFSLDFGVTWATMTKIGLTGTNNGIEIVTNNIVVSSSDGVFYYSVILDQWVNSLSVIGISVLYAPNILFAATTKFLYKSEDGIKWDNGVSINIEVNVLNKYKSLIVIGTNSGLYYDNGTFYSGGEANGSIVTFSSDPSKKVNDVCLSENGFVVGCSDGMYHVMNSGVFTSYVSGLDAVHKVLVLKNGDIWLFGFDKLKVPQIVNPIKLSTGMSF